MAYVGPNDRRVLRVLRLVQALDILAHWQQAGKMKPDFEKYVLEWGGGIATLLNKELKEEQ